MKKMYNFFQVQEFRKTAGDDKKTQTFIKRIGWPTDGVVR